jgi:hypothetical protein
VMQRKPSLITRTFGKIKDLPEFLIRATFSAFQTGFEAYGKALCGHVPCACPPEQSPRRIEAKAEPVPIRVREPQTKRLVVVRNRSGHTISPLRESQF